jgi:hypothetical protein
VDVDPHQQLVTMEMHGAIWRDGELVEQDTHVLKMTVYFTHEVKLMLEAAGFVDVQLTSDYTDDPPTRDTQFVVFIARKPFS